MKVKKELIVFWIALTVPVLAGELFLYQTLKPQVTVVHDTKMVQVTPTVSVTPSVSPIVTKAPVLYKASSSAVTAGVK